MLGVVKDFFTKKGHDRQLRELQKKYVEPINTQEKELTELPDEELKNKTQVFKNRLSTGATLEDILIEAFAVVREAARRVIKLRPFDVQLMGAAVLHQGKIAEMQTGEGKTLVATMPAYLNALTGKGVHIVTVNDYLAKRDRFWMGPVYEFLGLSVGLIQHDMKPEERKKAYACDIVYGTNTEFGFDYLRDNMALSQEQVVQRELNYAIIDEVDSILIDEARTPLIISGPAEDSTEIYYKIDRLVRRLTYGEDFDFEEKTRSIWLTEEGIARVEKLLHVDNLYQDTGKGSLEHLVRQSLRAHHLYRKDVDYVVKDGEVIIVDEFTGRLMHGRRYSDGLHQAIEAKEKLQVARENQTLASITYQNFFRMYQKTAGMTGTAKTEESEFLYTYGMPVVVIPTNKPLCRTNYPDVIYRTEKEKFEAVVREIEELHRIGRPVLVGTVSIDKSEKLSQMLAKKGIAHQVLNAKNHEREAEIIAQAGQRSAVTISTNMAGRGTDIILGEGIADLGGLHVVGTERHESRRIDNQLRGRAGRQGDPGSSRFFLSLEDSLLRLFGSDRISNLMDRLGVEEGVPIEHPLITRAIESAQKKVEGYHFNLRKTLLQYDDIMNQQREVIYSQRRQVLFEPNLRPIILGMLQELVAEATAGYAEEKTYPEEWDWEGLNRRLQYLFGISLAVPEAERADFSKDRLQEMIFNQVREIYQSRVREAGEEVFSNLERLLFLKIVDTHWKDHLRNMDHLREGIGLRAVGQRDPLVEYQLEAFDMFQTMVSQIREDLLRYLLRVRVVVKKNNQRSAKPAASSLGKSSKKSVKDAEREPVEQQVVSSRSTKVGRNDPCPCGSGLKYKYCCGKPS
ncbi:MAG: preprotein translocase subunit SecA [Candidatus Atribacteria bacterium]|nr:preprotein translocase subunit SecA [Candidatus Atribacteria bacterium]